MSTIKSDQFSKVTKLDEMSRDEDNTQSSQTTTKEREICEVSVNEQPDNWILLIDMKDQNLSSLPKFLPNYQFCTTLNLSGNNLESETVWLIHLKRLKTLDLSCNKLTKIADVCGSVSTLEYLNISFNLLEDFPEWILFLENARTLNLGFNPLKQSTIVHLTKARWKSVEICHLENVRLDTLPLCLQSANNLQELYLGRDHNLHQPSIYHDNIIWQFPTTLPSSLRVLDLSHICFHSFEHDWRKLTNLKVLKVKGNAIRWPADDFVLLENLEVCDMSDCKLILLPKDFGSLSNLYFIDLSYNQLTVIPKSFELLLGLNHLDLYNSGVETISCDLSCLPSLVKCDLWMNFINPVEVLPNHPKLCNNLRICLTVHERNSRLESSVSPSVVSDGSDEDSRSGTDIEEDQDDGVFEVSASSSETVIEESWDDKAFSDQDSDDEKAILDQISSISFKDDDVHYFVPSSLHAPSSVLPPNQFHIVQGQFDDID